MKRGSRKIFSVSPQASGDQRRCGSVGATAPHGSRLRIPALQFVGDGCGDGGEPLYTALARIELHQCFIKDGRCDRSSPGLARKPAGRLVGGGVQISLATKTDDRLTECKHNDLFAVFL